MKLVLFSLIAFHTILWGSHDLNNPQQVIRELVNANYQHNPELTILRLFEVDEEFFDKLAQKDYWALSKSIL